MLKKTFMALAVAGTVVIAGCGGGGGGGDGGSSTPKTRNDVVGPLDGLQGGLSSEILTPLHTAVAGTPLVGVVDCLDQSVVNDILDIADAIVLGIGPGAANPAAQLSATAANVQAEVTDLVADLQGLVGSLAGTTGCLANAGPQAGSGNPLAGTPLAALGAQLLPVLNQVQGQLGSAAPGSLSLGQISGLLGQVAQAFNGATGAIPPGVANAPVIGGVLDVVSQALADVQLTVAAAGTGNPTTAATQLTATVEHLLDGLLTQVIPIGLIENTSGQPDLVSGPIQAAIDQFTAALSGGLGSLAPAGLGNALVDPLGALLTPLQGDLLPLILDPIRAAISGGAGGGSIPVLTGTPLDGVLATLTGVLSGGAGGDPLTSLLGSLLGGLGGGGGGGVTCPLAGTPLAGLCGILGG
ncbi:hypothetical protein DFR24_1760 [Panacagrimonas perspica]|uniref:Uncharacterized protein n=1 Tax=Panacagrimonas perspica TaxID=381431 RepID=A0A4V3F6E1_9GAMM|nr:hypothetical protein [Panacagrimonas perspica]TDU32366.1 hypothetical protein DFR24_1760 [Panacagrimonas perspica]THD05300.1 hypothetical protein B1810_00690 [Panacagrimonas perspica]